MSDNPAVRTLLRIAVVVVVLGVVAAAIVFAPRLLGDDTPTKRKPEQTKSTQQPSSAEAAQVRKVALAFLRPYAQYMYARDPQVQLEKLRPFTGTKLMAHLEQVLPPRPIPGWETGTPTVGEITFGEGVVQRESDDLLVTGAVRFKQDVVPVGLLVRFVAGKPLVVGLPDVQLGEFE